jgi:hypothetical protein
MTRRAEPGGPGRAEIDRKNKNISRAESDPASDNNVGIG